MKWLYNKYVLAALILTLLPLFVYLRIKFPAPSYYEPGFVERLTDRSQYYIRELLDNNFQIFNVMLDEIRINFNAFYLIIITGITFLLIITIQIIATITYLPIGYLAYPGKFLIIKKSDKAQSTLTEEGESE